jgi:hypothetical protein
MDMPPHKNCPIRLAREVFVNERTFAMGSIGYAIHVYYEFVTI